MHGTGTNTVVVNEMFAKRNWPGLDAVGKRIRYSGEGNPWLTVVGVAKDEKHYGFDVPMRPGVFLPYHLSPSRQMTIVVRGLGDPQARDLVGWQLGDVAPAVEDAALARSRVAEDGHHQG